MKHPVRGDFDTAVTEAGVNVTFKPTNSIYTFYRLARSDDVARLGPAILRITPLMKFKPWRSAYCFGSGRVRLVSSRRERDRQTNATWSAATMM
jgi:hypothetical protein